jgi:hypothetical protein
LHHDAVGHGALRREALMRATKRHRPRKTDRFQAGTQADLDAMAEKVSYILSVEHKDYLTAAGPGKLRSDATACPRGLDFLVVLGWLRDAVRGRQISADFDGDFPRYAWTRVDGRVYEARLSNSGLGAYKDIPSTTTSRRTGYHE